MLSSESSTKVNTGNTLSLVSGPTAIAKDYYIKIRQAKTGNVWRLATPVSIGHDHNNQLMVGGINSNYVIVVDPSETLHLIDHAKGTVDGLKLLKFWGIKINGPYSGLAPKKHGLLCALREAFDDEQRLISKKLPRSLSLMLGSWMAQPLRLISWLLIATLMFQTYVKLIKEPDQSTIDRSNFAISLPFNQLNTTVYGAQSGYQVFAKGITFAFSDLPQENLVLSFDVQGLDGESELTLQILQKTIYRSTVDPKCLQTWCEQRIIIDKNSFNVEQIKLQFVHNAQFGDFKIRNLFLRQLRELLPSELNATLRWTSAAERHFRERDYAPENLLLARTENNKVLELTRSAIGTGELYEQAKIRNSDIDAALSELRSTLWFSAQRNKQLVNLVDARKDLQLLMRSLEPQDERFALVRGELDYVERMLQ